MQWLLGKPSEPAAAGDAATRSVSPPVKKPQQQLDKLRGYRDLAQDAIERAINKDSAGLHQEAAQLYRTGLSVIYEGLGLNVPSSGLDAAHNNVAKWRSEMNIWQQQVLDRLRDLESPTPSTSQQTPRTNPIPSLGHAGLGSAAGVGPRRVGSAAAGSAAPRMVPPRNGALRPTQTAPPARPAAVSKEEQLYDDRILSEVLDSRPSVTWDDVAGLPTAKQALHEMVILPTLRADLFRGLRAPARGLLLYGPPGNGKTMLAKALAHEAKATFFNISASSLTSKWHGDAEKMVRALFRVTSKLQPAIIFIDEIDSILSERSSSEHEASRRLKTEFLVQFDGVAGGSDRVVVLGATNRPWELDDAVRRRLPKRVYVPLPDAAGRRAIIQHLLRDQPHKLSKSELERVVVGTEGYSGSDLAALCKEAAMVPLRDLGSAIATVSADQVRPVRLADFATALASIKPSVSREQLHKFEKWTADFGTPS